MNRHLISAADLSAGDGVAVRMAVLYLLLGGSTGTEPEVRK